MSLKENLGHEHWRKDCASKEIETSDAGAASELLGVTRQSISRWEQNQAYPEMEKILRLSDILGVSCDYLLKENVTKKDCDTVGKGKTFMQTRLLKSLMSKK